MKTPPKPPFGRVRDFVKFISARERHRVAKEGGRAVDKPDDIISRFRFCNVRRNDDRVTRWIHEHYLEEWRESPDLWFALMVARLFNNEDTLAEIKQHVLPFKPGPMLRTLHMRKAMGKKTFNAAYIVSTAGERMDKLDYVVERILIPAWRDRVDMANSVALLHTLDIVHAELMRLNGMASFMAAQVVADLKYADPKKWEDFHTFAASGPGSRRGINRVYGLDKDEPMTELVFRARLAVLRDSVNRLLPKWEPITAQDIQNCLCEFDKYERARTGDGVPKQLYKPKEN